MWAGSVQETLQSSTSLLQQKTHSCWQKQAYPSIPCRTMSPRFDLQDSLTSTGFLFFPPLFQSRSTSPEHHPFALQSPLLSDQTPIPEYLLNTFSQQFCNLFVSRRACSPGQQSTASLLLLTTPLFDQQEQRHLETEKWGTNRFSGCSLGNLSCCCPTGCSLQMLQHVPISPSGSFSFPHFHPERAAHFPSQSFYYSVSLPWPPKRGFLALSFPCFQELTKKWVILSHWRLFVQQSSENYLFSHIPIRRLKHNIYNLLLQSSSASITVTI